MVEDKNWHGAGDAPTPLMTSLVTDKTRKAHKLVQEIKKVMLNQVISRSVTPSASGRDRRAVFHRACRAFQITAPPRGAWLRLPPQSAGGDNVKEFT